MRSEEQRRRMDAISRVVKAVISEATTHYEGREHRKHPRLKYTRPIEITVDEDTTDMAMAKDITSFGIGFLYTRALTGKVTVKLKNRLGDEYCLVAEVMRSRQVGRFYEMGARFLERVE